MYIHNLNLRNIRTFVKNDISFVHPDLEFRPKGDANGETSKLLPKPRLPNVNLLLGDNGSGKTTVLQAIALASLGPAAVDAKLQLNKFVRFSNDDNAKNEDQDSAIVSASLRLHKQDSKNGSYSDAVASPLRFQRLGELEKLSFGSAGDLFHDEVKKGLAKTGLWGPVYESKNEAFFCVAYGATRRVESGESMESGRLSKSSFLRGQTASEYLSGFFCPVSVAILAAPTEVRESR